MNGHRTSVVVAFAVAMAVGLVAEGREFGPGKAGRHIGQRRVRRTRTGTAARSRKRVGKLIRKPGSRIIDNGDAGFTRGKRVTKPWDSPGDDTFKPGRAGFALPDLRVRGAAVKSGSSLAPFEKGGDDGFALPDLRVHKRPGAKVQSKAAKASKAPSKGAGGDPIADFDGTEYPTFDDLGAHPTDSDDPVVKEGAELLLGIDGDDDGDGD